jgi:hypothetical protein
MPGTAHTEIHTIHHIRIIHSFHPFRVDSKTPFRALSIFTMNPYIGNIQPAVVKDDISAGTHNYYFYDRSL